MNFDDKGNFNRLWHKYNEAKLGNCFIYNKSSNEWFTPEQFWDRYHKAELPHRTITSLLEDLVIRDPVAGVKAAQKQILSKVEDLHQEIARELSKLTEFSKMTIQYHQSKLKK